MTSPASSFGNLIRNWLSLLVTPVLLGSFVTVIVCCQASALQRNERVARHVAEVKSGMSEAEVRELLGNPDQVRTGATDPINLAVSSATRRQPARDKTSWEYRYSFGTNGQGRGRWKSSTIYFKDGKVTFNASVLGY